MSIKTNFLDEQAKESSQSPLKLLPVRILIGIVVVGILFGAYKVVEFFLNFEKNSTIKNVTIDLKNPTMQMGQALVNVRLFNYNTVPISAASFRFEVKNNAGGVVASGVVPVKGYVPPGDERTFHKVNLGLIEGETARMQAELVDVSYTKATEPNDLKLDFAEACAKQGQEGIDALKTFVKNYPKFVPGYVALGRAYQDAEYYQEAGESYKQALALDPNCEDAHYRDGMCLLHLKDKAGAKAELTKAQELVPDDQEVKESMVLVE